MREIEWIVSLLDFIGGKSKWWFGGTALTGTGIGGSATFGLYWPLFIFGVGALFCIIMALRKDHRAQGSRDPDMPIRDAIQHAVKEVPHSYERSGPIERSVFEQIHQLMCSGEISVWGETGEGGPLQKISPKKCRKLSPQEVVVPQGPAAPEGVRFSLIGETKEKYRYLRVCSDEIYKFWPKGREE